MAISTATKNWPISQTVFHCKLSKPFWQSWKHDQTMLVATPPSDWLKCIQVSVICVYMHELSEGNRAYSAYYSLLIRAHNVLVHSWYLGILKYPTPCLKNTIEQWSTEPTLLQWKTKASWIHAVTCLPLQHDSIPVGLHQWKNTTAHHAALNQYISYSKQLQCILL